MGLVQPEYGYYQYRSYMFNLYNNGRAGNFVLSLLATATERLYLKI